MEYNVIKSEFFHNRCILVQSALAWQTCARLTNYPINFIFLLLGKEANLSNQKT